jgi:hypothetical protein
MPKKQISREHGTVRVTFELPAAVGGEVVHLVGDFTGWEGIPMKRQDDGGWRATLDLAPGGTFEYRYLIDGERWENDWAADRYVRNVFGHENSVVETPAIAGDRTRGRSEDEGARKATSRRSTPKQASGAGPATKKAATKKAATKKAASRRTEAKKTAAGRKTPKKATPGKATTKRPAKGTSAARKPAQAPRSEGAPPAGPPQDDVTGR